VGTVSLANKERQQRYGTVRIVASVLLTRGNAMNHAASHGIRFGRIAAMLPVKDIVKAHDLPATAHHRGPFANCRNRDVDSGSPSIAQSSSSGRGLIYRPPVLLIVPRPNLNQQQIMYYDTLRPAA
jgi:hypothetical protein